MTQVEFIKTFNRFPIKAKLSIAKKNQLQVIDEMFEDIDKKLPNVEMSSDEIQNEINAYRNEKREA